MNPQSPGYKPTISHEEFCALPVKAFEGDIIQPENDKDTLRALQEVTMQKVLGFDTETPPSFRKGISHPVTLIQIAIPKKVFLLRIRKARLKQEIIALLTNDTITKAGVGIQNDINALQKLHLFRPRGFLELAALAKTAGIEVAGIKKLAAIILGFRISKKAQTSNWAAPKYTNQQIRYAATDAWVCLELYHKLTKTLP